MRASSLIKLVQWDRVENFWEDVTSVALYYRDGHDWLEIRALIKTNQRVI
jgi:hypothetical protein